MNANKLKSGLAALLPYSLGNFRIASCYLDMTKGIDHCLDWLSEQIVKAHFYAGGAEGKSQLLSVLKTEISNHRDTDAQSLALFWRVGQDDALVSVMPLPIRSANRISVYRQPDIRPLLPLLNDESNATILAYLDKRVHVFDVSLGKIKPVSWALAPHLSGNPVSSYSGNLDVGGENQLKALCTSLIHLRYKPLILVAKSEDIPTLKAWLPDVIEWNLDSCFTLPKWLGKNGLSSYIGQQYRLQQRMQSSGLANRLLSVIRSRGPATAGTVASLRSIQENRAKRLLITHETLTEPGGYCSSCGAMPLDIGQADTCPGCGQGMSIQFHHVIESCWMAYQQNIPVYPVESSELLYLGGVGCILKQKGISNSQPFTPAGSRHGLELVA